MNAIYDEAKGEEWNLIDSPDLASRLGEDNDEVRQAVKYLDAEGLVKAEWFLSGDATVSLDHRGIVEVERSRSTPSEPTEHLAPYQSIQVHVHGDLVNSPMQIASPGASQNVMLSSDDLGQIRLLIELFKSRGEELPLDGEDRAEAGAEIATLEAQVSSPKPKPGVIRVALETLRALLIATVASGAGEELLRVIAGVLK
jgi:hypothetical protein